MQKHIVIDARIRPSGTGRYIDCLLEHLQKIDQENRYSVLLAPGDAWRPEAANFRVVRCRFKQFSFNPFDQLAFAWQIYKLKPDLVHFAMTQQPLFYFGNIVTTTHDLTMLGYTRPGRLPVWLHQIRMAGYRLIFWAAHKKSKVIIVPSHFVAKDLAKHQPSVKSKITVTYEASEPEFIGEPKQPSGVNKPFIMHVGSPFPHKNIERLIEAFALVKQSQPNLRLVLAGKKEFYFEKLARHFSNFEFIDDVIMPGRVTDQELKWLYKNAESYVLPSLSEGFGLPGLEAFAHGCPLASSNATCLSEIYGEAAHYFDPTDVRDMAEKIEELLVDKILRQRLIKLGYEQVKKYSWDKTAEQTLEIYKELLKN